MAEMENGGYASFLIRCWRAREAGSRIKIEHIQTGDWAGVGSLEESLSWLATRLEELGAGEGEPGDEIDDPTEEVQP